MMHVSSSSYHSANTAWHVGSCFSAFYDASQDSDIRINVPCTFELNNLLTRSNALVTALVLLTCCQCVFHTLEARLFRQLHFRRSGGLAEFCFPVVDLICATLNPIQVRLQRLAVLQNLRRESRAQPQELLSCSAHRHSLSLSLSLFQAFRGACRRSAAPAIRDARPAESVMFSAPGASFA